MGTVPTNQLETELRKLYLQWLGGIDRHPDDLPAYIKSFETKSRALITKLGGQTASLGALADFPVPKLLELSPHAGTVYDDMQQSAIKASIAAGISSTDAARQILNAGLGKSFNKLNRLARTETVSAYWKNQWDSVADLPLIVMVWSSENGPRTCQYCQSRDGLVVEDGNIRDHPNGRCTLIPTLRSQLKYIGTLEADGSVTFDKRYGKPDGKAKPLPQDSQPTAEQQNPLSGKTNPVKPSKAQAVHAPAPSVAKTVPVKPAIKQPAIVPPTNPRVIKTTADMKDFGSKMPVPSTLSAKAADIVNGYAQGTAYTTNAVLRGQKTYLGRTLDPRTKVAAKKFTKEMDSMMDASIIHEDVRVVRAVQADAFGGVDALKDLAGSIYQDKGYMSTSLAEKVSSSVYNVKDAVDMEIVVPKGTRALYMAGESYLKSERELLLDRGTNLAIQSATYNERTKKWLVKAIVVPGPR